jgi:hypothetical protein
MLQMDEGVAQTPLKDLAQVELVLARIPTKALYKLQVSVTQEVQSRTRTDAVELQGNKEWQGCLGIGSRAGEARNKGGKRMHG